MSDLTRLNPTPHAIAVYASQPLSPVATQHSLPSRTLPFTWAGLSPAGSHQLCLAHSLDHLVGDGEQPWRKAQAECFGGVEVDHEIEFGRLHHRQVRGLRALQDATNIDTSQAMCIGNVRSIAHETADFGKLTQVIDGKQSVVSRQRNELYAAIVGQRAGTDQKR